MAFICFQYRRQAAIAFALVFAVAAIGEEPAKPPVAPVAPSNPAPAAAALKPGDLEGISLTIPAEWPAEAFRPGPMAPKAVFRLPKLEPDAEDASIRITHFPEMKGKNDQNIDRWISMVKTVDGKPAARSDAKITTMELGEIKITVVDISGSISTSMAGSGVATPNQRSINAIIEHPKGPHYVRVVGGKATMEKWESAIQGLLKSATVKK